MFDQVEQLAQMLQAVGLPMQVFVGARLAGWAGRVGGWLRAGAKVRSADTNLDLSCSASLAA